MEHYITLENKRRKLRKVSFKGGWGRGGRVIKTTDYRPTDTPTSYHLPIDPLTTYPPTH